MSQTLTLSQALQTAIQYQQAGQWQAAEVLYRQVLQRLPNQSQALQFYLELGNLLLKQGRLTDAIGYLQLVLTLNPNYAEGYALLGNIFLAQHQSVQAMACYQRALTLNPNFVEAYNNLGTVLMNQNQQTEAVACYQRALTLNPNFAEAYSNLGNVYREQGQLTEAISYYRRAVALNPNFADIHNNLGALLSLHDQLTEALVCLQRALSLDPNSAEAYANVGGVLREMGRIEEAVKYYQRALELKPTEALFYMALVMTLHYSAHYDPLTIFLAHQQFNERYAKPLTRLMKPHLNERTPRRKLKIGYASPDFRRHSVVYFIEPILAQHDRSQFEIVCYYNCPNSDEVTLRLQRYVDHWRDCFYWSDEELAERIRQDQIDILVDLMGYTGNNRLLALAQKPAPVQMTYLGYSSTTGLTAMDYRLTDAYTDPEGIAEQFSSETLVRMPHSYFCYQPADETYLITVNPPPVLQNGYLTFGSFNHHPKLSPEILTLWVTILRALPTSKLFIKSRCLADATVQQNLMKYFTSGGIAPERLILSPFALTLTEHLTMYHQIDIALDSYPYNGATTTCEALWMGVPVVTLVGVTHVSRMGLSILETLGLTELIAYTNEEYVNIALKLANDREQLQHLRATMRARMQSSALMDATSFARHLETVYRGMWEKWCRTSG